MLKRNLLESGDQRIDSGGPCREVSFRGSVPCAVARNNSSLFENASQRPSGDQAASWPRMLPSLWAVPPTNGNAQNGISDGAAVWSCTSSCVWSDEIPRRKLLGSGDGTSTLSPPLDETSMRRKLLEISE